jgi:hypothetical protein
LLSSSLGATVPTRGTSPSGAKSLLVGALASAHATRDAIAASGLDIYEPLLAQPELLYTLQELEVLLREHLSGMTLAGPIRTRSKLAKQAVCAALGYPAPRTFKRVKPRLPGQDLDVYVQKHDNLQIWNEEIGPTRRYAVIRVNAEGHVLAVRVAEGTEIAALDTTGTLTSKYQARRRTDQQLSKLVSAADTPRFRATLDPVEELDPTTLESLSPTKSPTPGTVLTIGALYSRLLSLVGSELPYSPSERLRGEALHRLVCETLGLGGYADTGRFPDILCQALEVKLQTSPTIDLGLISPLSEEPALTLSPHIQHSDVRYLVAYGAHDGSAVRISHVVLTTGHDFASEFRQFGGLEQNRKLQLRLPSSFFQTE